jgi:hypothetical protein
MNTETVISLYFLRTKTDSRAALERFTSGEAQKSVITTENNTVCGSLSEELHILLQVKE